MNGLLLVVMDEWIASGCYVNPKKMQENVNMLNVLLQFFLLVFV